MEKLLLWLLLVVVVDAFELQKPMVYREQNVTGWWMSEKLDGVRGYWNGKHLQTKAGYEIDTPKYFTQNFPPFALDGELWIERGGYAKVQSIVLDENPSPAWRGVRYNIFEVPGAEGDFIQRLHKAKKWFAEHPNRYVKFIKQYRCESKNALVKFLDKIEKLGGEGVVVKDGDRGYVQGRTAYELKVKHFADAEGVVVAINEGRGENRNRMGSLTIALKNGKRFKLGNGFTKAEREEPPKIGEIVKFKYYGLTKNELPRFASYICKRNAKTMSTGSLGN